MLQILSTFILPFIRISFIMELSRCYDCKYPYFTTVVTTVPIYNVMNIKVVPIRVEKRNYLCMT